MKMNLHKTEHQKTLEDKLYVIGLILFPIVCIGGILLKLAAKAQLLIPTCIVFRLFKLYCPGCGGTRAVVSLFQGDLLHCLWYHPLVFYGAALYLYFMITHTLVKLHIPHVKAMKYRDGYLFIALGIILVNFVLKNILVIFFNIYM